MCVETNLQDKIKMRTAQEENDLIKIALSQVNINIFIYNVSSRKIEFIDNNSIHPLGNLKKFVELEEIYASGVVHHDHLDKLRELFEKISCEESSASATIKIKFLLEWTWQNIIMHCCFSESRDNIQIIGTIQDVTNRV